MHIVTQSASFLYSPSLIPPVPLLSAPPAPKLLAAPPIAGLLPARVLSPIEVIVDLPLTRAEVLRQLGPIRSRAEMNAEIAALMAAPYPRFAAYLPGAPAMNDNFSDSDIPEQEDYRAVMDPLIEETRLAIREALGYIERQEDGPLTMTFTLRAAEKRLSAVECESWYVTSQVNRLHIIITRLLAQRDEAIHQRDLLMLLAMWSRPPDNAQE